MKYLKVLLIFGIMLGTSGCTTIVRCAPPPEIYTKRLDRPTILVKKGMTNKEFIQALNSKFFPYVERLEGDRRAVAVWVANCK